MSSKKATRLKRKAFFRVGKEILIKVIAQAIVMNCKRCFKLPKNL